MEEIPAEVLPKIQVSLHHMHLPKLEAAGMIEYDSERQLVELTNAFDQFQPALSAINSSDPHLVTPLEW